MQVEMSEKPAIAPPVFVFQKSERPLKRPAEDPLSKDANGVTACFEKRGRSSSFTFTPATSRSLADVSETRVRSASFTATPTFPPSRLVRRNNVFMPSTLCQMSSDGHLGSVKESASLNQHWNVIRPAILQPPQIQTFTQPAVLDNAKEAVATHQVQSEKVFQIDSVSTLSPPEDFRSARKSAKPNAFLQLTQSEPARCPMSQDATLVDGNSPCFVFGENMSERVLSPHTSLKSNEEDAEEETASSAEETTTGSGPFNTETPCTKDGPIGRTTLMESAAAYSAASTQKCLLDTVQVITGEEAESNVLQVNCKLFVYNKCTQSWTERGRGCLRLNDTASDEHGTFQSRLVMRHQGNLRLILNTKLWADMHVDRANRKSLCCTATDLEDKSIRIFLIQAGAKDIGRLYVAMHHRLVALRSCAVEESDSNQTESNSESSVPSWNSDSEDEEDDELSQSGCSGSGRCGWTPSQSVVCT